MTMPKKKSRPIEVNGRKYRWMVKALDKYDDTMVKITIEDQETGEIAQALRHGWGGDAAMVTPRDIKEIIISRFNQP